MHDVTLAVIVYWDGHTQQAQITGCALTQFSS